MKNYINPFLTIGYISKDYFCDRKNELEILKKNIANGIHTTLISIRRLGKSSTIFRLFDEFDQENSVGIYVDIYACTNLKDFTETLALAIFNKFPVKRGIGRLFFDFLKRLRPVISYDTLSGQPEIHFEFAQVKEYEHTVRSLLQFVDNQPLQVVLAIDEFQQITSFPEKNIEALLRTIMQTLKNTRFIFSGSRKHLMLELFNVVNRPFFTSTQIMELNEIPTDKYSEFIHEKFMENKRIIEADAVDFILSWTLSHTYYTQAICNGVFAGGQKNVTLDMVKQVCNLQLNSQQATCMQYRNLLTPIQWKVLIAIAKEGWVTEPQSQGFLQKHKLGASSSVQKAVNALLDKEMIYSVEQRQKTAYRVYNLFLMRWLERTF